MNLKEYQELPFSERDFAIWMDQLEGKLFAFPDWKDILTYRGVSVYDSAYAPIYWEMLKAYRKSFKPPTHLEKQLTFTERLLNIAARLASGEMTFKQGIKIGLARVQEQIIMQFSPPQLPKFSKGKRALVVRAFLNKSAFPILPLLRKEGLNLLFASWNEKLAQPVKEMDIPYIHLKYFYRREYKNIFHKHQQQVGDALRNVNCHLPGRLLASLSGFPLEWDAYELLIKNIVQIRTYIDIYLDLIDRFKPDVVILFNENSYPGRTMANVARIKGVPSVAIQHGLFIGSVYRNLATDKMIVWGEIPRKFWLDRGCLPEQVISVGAIAHENWLNKYGGSKNGYTKNNDHKIVLIIGQNPAAFMSMEMHVRTIAAIIYAARELPHVRFVIKPHPGESPSSYQTAMEKARLENIEIVLEGEIEKCLLKCDLVITVFSTAGIEAMLLRCPVIVLNLSSEPSIAPYSIITSVVQHPLKLVEEIEIIFNNTLYYEQLVENGYKFAQDYLGLRDVGESAAVKAVSVITELVEGNKDAKTER